jgi:hypothetical protein
MKSDVDLYNDDSAYTEPHWISRIIYAHGVPPSTMARSSHRNQLPVFAKNWYEFEKIA